MKRGKLVSRRGIQLSSGNKIGNPYKNGYKYLDILEQDQNLKKNTKRTYQKTT